jgi:hypothetical protein
MHIRNTLSWRQYTCGFCHNTQQHLVWSKELEDKIHICITKGCNCEISVEDLSDLPTEDHGVQIMTKMKPGEVHSDRKKRSDTHFKKEIYPMFSPGSQERAHFARKHGLKK